MRIVIDMQGLQTLSSAHRGVGRYTENIVLELLKIGTDHEFYLVMNSEFPEAAVRIRNTYADLVPSHRMLAWDPFFGITYTSNKAALLEAAEIFREVFLNSLQPDIIFSTNLQEGSSEPAVTSVKRIETSALYCTTLHDVVPLFHTHYLSEGQIRNWYMAKIDHARQSDILLTVSQSSKSDIVEKLFIPDDQIHVIENGYNNSIFNTTAVSAEQEAEIRKNYNINGDFIIHYGGGDVHKNIPSLISAFELIAPDHRQGVSLVLVGREIALNPDIKRLVDDSTVADSILMPGFVEDSDLPLLLKVARGFVFPSTHEGFGLPVLEAMACGAPVIGSAHASVAEILNNPVATFDPKSPHDIAKKIELLLTDDKFRLQLIDNGPKNAARYSWERSAQNLLQIFERCVQARGPAAPSGMEDPVEVFVENVRHLTPELTTTDLAKMAQSVADTFAPPRKNKIFLDISTIVALDHKSGIQRVTRAIFLEFFKSPPAGYDVDIVYSNISDLNFYVANNFMNQNLIFRPSTSRTSKTDNYVDFRCGDILIYLDLNPSIAIAHKAYNARLRAKGVSVYHVVYDIIPVLKPETFWPGLCNEFATWLETVSTSDGALCISASVAAELKSYVTRFGEKRDDPFNIGWFHLGADIHNSVPTTGLPSNADDVMAKIRRQTTFLMVGTLEPRKGHRQVLAAFDQLWAAGENVALVIFGRLGWMMDEFATTLKDHKEYGDRLFWITGGSDEYLDLLYKTCDGLIAASDAEGFGLPLVEAAQYGIPVIARAIPVFKEVAGDHAFYFENSPDARVIANAVVAWTALKAAGKHPTSADMPWLTWRESAAQLVDILRSKRWSYQTTGEGALRLSAPQDHSSPRLKWVGFGVAERDKRWSLGTRASLGFDWGDSTAPARLNLQLSTFGLQQVGIHLNGTSIHASKLDGQHLILALNLPALIDGQNVLEFSLPDARSPGGADTRMLAIAIHNMSITPALQAFELGVDHEANSRLIEWTGFGSAEQAFRWTAGYQASASLFLAAFDSALMLSIRTFAFGDQNVTIRVNDDPIFSGIVGASSRLLKFRVETMKPGYNVISFDLPDARAPGNGDNRMLGVALQSIRLEPTRRRIPAATRALAWLLGRRSLARRR
jgi:glycosyltransferase involved in cell wall biosynthesis